MPENVSYGLPGDNQDWTGKEFFIECTVTVENPNGLFKDVFTYPLELRVHKYDPEHDNAITIDFARTSDRDNEPVKFICDGFGDDLRAMVHCNQKNRVYLASLVDSTKFGLTNVRESEKTAGIDTTLTHQTSTPYLQSSWEYYDWALLDQAPMSNSTDFDPITCTASTEIDIDNLSKEKKYRYVAIAKAQLQDTGMNGDVFNSNARIQPSYFPVTPVDNDTIGKITDALDRLERADVPSTDTTLFRYDKTTMQVDTVSTDNRPTMDLYILNKPKDIWYQSNPNINFNLSYAERKPLSKRFLDWMTVIDIIIPTILNNGIDYTSTPIFNLSFDIDLYMMARRDCLNPVIRNYYVYMENDYSVRTRHAILGMDDSFYGDYMFFRPEQFNEMHQMLGYNTEFEKTYSTNLQDIYKFQYKFGYESFQKHRNDRFLGFVVETKIYDIDKKEYFLYPIVKPEVTRFDVPLGSEHNENYYMYFDKVSGNLLPQFTSTYTYHLIDGCGTGTAVAPAYYEIFEPDASLPENTNDYTRIRYEEVLGSGVIKATSIAPGYTLVGFIFNGANYIPITVLYVDRMCMTDAQQAIKAPKNAYCNRIISTLNYLPSDKALFSDVYVTDTTTRIRKTPNPSMDMSPLNFKYDGPATIAMNHGDKIYVQDINSGPQFKSYIGDTIRWDFIRVSNNLFGDAMIRLGNLPFSFRFVFDPLDFTPTVRTLLFWSDRNYNECLTVMLMPDLRICVSLSNKHGIIEIVCEDYVVPGYMNSVYVNLWGSSPEFWSIIINGKGSSLKLIKNVLTLNTPRMNLTQYNGDIVLMVRPDINNATGAHLDSSSNPAWICLHSVSMYSRHINEEEAFNDFKKGTINEAGYELGMVWSVACQPINGQWVFSEAFGKDIEVFKGA